MPNMSAAALRTAVMQAAIADAAFRSELAKDCGRAIETRFGAQQFPVEVVFEKEGELSLLIPDRTDQLVRSVDRLVKDVGDKAPTRGQFEAMLLQKAWNDAAFLAGLQSDPRTTLNGLLKKYGSSVPADKTVVIHQEKPGACTVVIPRPATAGAAGELSDTELEAVAGGEAVVTIAVVTVAGGVVGGVASAIVGEWVCGPAQVN